MNSSLILNNYLRAHLLLYIYIYIWYQLIPESGRKIVMIDILWKNGSRMDMPTCFWNTSASSESIPSAFVFKKHVGISILLPFFHKMSIITILRPDSGINWYQSHQCGPAAGGFWNQKIYQGEIGLTLLIFCWFCFIWLLILFYMIIKFCTIFCFVYSCSK